MKKNNWFVNLGGGRKSAVVIFSLLFCLVFATYNLYAQTYVEHNIATMIKEVESNKLKAERKYLNSYVKVRGKVSKFDKDFYDKEYVSIIAPNDSSWLPKEIRCYTKNKQQLDKLFTYDKGDLITIKGKITEVDDTFTLTYTLIIDSIE